MALSELEQQELGEISVSFAEDAATISPLPPNFCTRLCRAKYLVCTSWPNSQACQDLTALANEHCNGCST